MFQGAEQYFVEKCEISVVVNLKPIFQTHRSTEAHTAIVFSLSPATFLTVIPWHAFHFVHRQNAACRRTALVWICTPETVIAHHFKIP